LWILCSGKWKADWSELEHTGSLLRVDPLSLSTELELHFSSPFSEPKQLISNASGTMLYYSYQGKVYAHDIRSETLETKAYINKNAYSLGFDKKMDMIYVGIALDYVSKAYVFRYNAQNASLIDSFKTGIIPTHFEFAD
jgi:hypothetical protein